MSRNVIIINITIMFIDAACYFKLSKPTSITIERSNEPVTTNL